MARKKTVLSRVRCIALQNAVREKYKTLGSIRAVAEFYNVNKKTIETILQPRLIERISKGIQTIMTKMKEKGIFEEDFTLTEEVNQAEFAQQGESCTVFDVETATTGFITTTCKLPGFHLNTQYLQSGYSTRAVPGAVTKNDFSQAKTFVYRFGFTHFDDCENPVVIGDDISAVVKNMFRNKEIWVHNGKFDFHFLLPLLHKYYNLVFLKEDEKLKLKTLGKGHMRGKACMNGSRIYQIKLWYRDENGLLYKVTMRDTFHLEHGPLEKLAQSPMRRYKISLPYPDVQKKAMNHNMTRLPGDSHEVVDKYLINDLTMTIATWRDVKEVFSKDATFCRLSDKLTAASFSFANYAEGAAKAEMGAAEWLALDVKDRKKKIKLWLRDNLPAACRKDNFETALHEEARFSNAGGVVFANRNKRFLNELGYTVSHETVCFDVNSMYPAIYAQKKLPFGDGVRHKGYVTGDDKYCFYRYKRLAFKLPENCPHPFCDKHLPIIKVDGKLLWQFEKGKNNYPFELNFSGTEETLSGYVPETVHEYIVKHSDPAALDFEVAETLVFDGRTGVFKDFVTEYYDLRVKLADEIAEIKQRMQAMSGGDAYDRLEEEILVKEASRFMLKIILNAGGGKAGQKPVFEEKVINFKNDIIQSELTMMPMVVDDGNVLVDNEGNEVMIPDDRLKADSMHMWLFSAVTAHGRVMLCEAANRYFPGAVVYTDTDSLHVNYNSIDPILFKQFIADAYHPTELGKFSNEYPRLYMMVAFAAKHYIKIPTNNLMHINADGKIVIRKTTGMLYNTRYKNVYADEKTFSDLFSTDAEDLEQLYKQAQTMLKHIVRSVKLSDPAFIKQKLAAVDTIPVRFRLKSLVPPVYSRDYDVWDGERKVYRRRITERYADTGERLSMVDFQTGKVSFTIAGYDVDADNTHLPPGFAKTGYLPELDIDLLCATNRKAAETQRNARCNPFQQHFRGPEDNDVIFIKQSPTTLARAGDTFIFAPDTKAVAAPQNPRIFIPNLPTPRIGRTPENESIIDVLRSKNKLVIEGKSGYIELDEE